MSEDFSGQVVIVTGACGGIGEAIVKSFASAGAGVALCDTREAELDDLTEQLQSDGAAVKSQPLDVTDSDAVERFCSSVARDLGSIDHLINTVGVVDHVGDVIQLSLESWNKCLSTNLTSAFIMAKHSVPHMMSAGGGSIVNIASVSAFGNQLGAMAYSVSKAGMVSLTKSEAIDLARHNIRANAICPGSVYTPLVDMAVVLTAAETGRTPDETRSDWEEQYPTGRFSYPREVAEMALFLCSDRAANVTGSSFVVDGGLTALLPER
jgi:NAD(P)-dependent dehydrogenase (short-subunit alcohol dehydrogenase family)